MTINALLAAMVAVLGYLAISTGNFKITFETLPILVAALLLGHVSSFSVAAIGTFIYQLLKFGLMPTTPMWMIPYIAMALVVGIYAKSKDFKLSQKQTVFIVVLGEFLVTLLNTGALYVDSHIYGYYYPTFITGMLIPRLVVCFAKGLAFAFLLPPLIKKLHSSKIV